MSNSMCFNRGQLFDNCGDTYMLVRESDRAPVYSANGTLLGHRNLFNLVNLTNSGKTRVSEPTHKLESTLNSIDINDLRTHFNMPNLTPTVRVENVDIAGAVRASMCTAHYTICEQLRAQEAYIRKYLEAVPTSMPMRMSYIGN